MNKDNIDIVVEKRTKGKWFHLPVTDKGKQIPILTDAANETIVCFIGIKGQPNEANAAFICKAVNEYDNLKEQIKSLQVDLDFKEAIKESALKRIYQLDAQNKCLLEALKAIQKLSDDTTVSLVKEMIYKIAQSAIKANETI